MIPSHDSGIVESEMIKIIQLDTLQSYDFGVPHRHDYFELFYFKKGDGKHMIDFIDFSIEDSNIHLVSPDQIHQVKREKNSFGYVILFHQNVFKEEGLIENFLFNWTCNSVENEAPVFKFSSNAQLDFYFDKIQNSAFQEKQVRDVEVKGMLRQILLECYKLKSLKGVGENTEYVQFRRTVRNNFKTRHKVQDYAKLLGISEKRLNELTKVYIGKTARQLIYDHIILESKRHLKLNHSAKETAYHLSFDDPSHFSKFFKSQTGFTPKQFQNLP